MKNIMKIGLLLLLCAIISVTVVTATDNKDLPSQEEVTQFISEMKGSSASDILDKVKEDHSTWNADLLECSTCSGNKEAIALYYTASTEKGYGSVYCNETGVVSPSSLSGYTLKECYKGELDESDNNTEENSSEPEDENDSNVIKDDETEKNSNYTYDRFTTALHNYDGSFSCKNISCAQSLSDYFKNLGWGTEVKYCVAVNTSDEGTVYVVLGV